MGCTSSKVAELRDELNQAKARIEQLETPQVDKSLAHVCVRLQAELQNLPPAAATKLIAQFHEISRTATDESSAVRPNLVASSSTADSLSEATRPQLTPQPSVLEGSTERVGCAHTMGCTSSKVAELREELDHANARVKQLEAPRVDRSPAELQVELQNLPPAAATKLIAQFEATRPRKSSAPPAKPPPELAASSSTADSLFEATRPQLMPQPSVPEGSEKPTEAVTDQERRSADASVAGLWPSVAGALQVRSPTTGLYEKVKAEVFTSALDGAALCYAFKSGQPVELRAGDV